MTQTTDTTADPAEATDKEREASAVSDASVRVVERYVAAYNAHDAVDIVAVHHPDVRIIDGDVLKLEGRDEIYEKVFALQFGNDGWLEVISRVHAGNWVVDTQIMHHTGRGDLRIPVAYRVIDGQIDRVIYLDPEGRD